MNNLMKLMMAGLISITTIGVSQNITTPQTTVNQQTKQAEVVVEETSKTLQEAKQIALNYVNGTITKTKEDNDDYTIYVKKDNYLYEIEVNKKTGEIDDVDKEKVVSSTKTTTITLTKAKQIALNYVNGTITKTKEDNDDYTIYVKKDNYLYEIEVNKKTGKIEEVDKEKIKTTSSNITLSQAKELALKEVNGKIISTKTDDDDYEITVQKDGYIYEIEVNKKTGKITDIDKEKVKTSVDIISANKAKEIALKEVSGTVVSVDYDDDDYKYDVEIVKDNIEYEVEIDAKNGNVIKVEKDD